MRKGARRALAPIAMAAALCAACWAPAAWGAPKGLVPLDVSPRALDAAHAPRRIALLVGVGRFDDPAWRRLRFPRKDVADLAGVLSDPKRGAFTHVETAVEPTRAELRRALDRLAEADRDERDTVVVYLSSHGTLARDGRGQLRRYLVTRDTNMNDIPGTALAVDELKARFDGLRSRRKVLVLAACHSGGGKSLLPGAVQSELGASKAGFLARPIEEVSRASVVLAAADWGETAREDEKLQNDIYTHFLVEALRGGGADRNGDGAVTVTEAHDYARRRTYDFTDGRQRPSAESTEVGADAIVLVGRVRRTGRPELYSYAPALDGFTVRVDGRALAELPGGVAVPAGRHRVQLAKGAEPDLVDVPVTLDSGERVDLERLLARSEGRWEVAPRVGVLGFLGRSGEDVLGPVFAAGAALTLREWPARRMALRIDALASAGSGAVGQAGFGYTAVVAGVALPWRFGVGPRGLTLLAGPRLSTVYVSRQFQLALARAPQSYLVVTPGAVVGLGWDLTRHVSLGAEVQVDWALVRVDGQDRSSAFGAVLLGVGYRF